jgi:hypothetical protein
MLKRKADSPPISPRRDVKTRSQSIVSTPKAEAPKKCSFLDKLPPELRLTIYEYLVISPSPLKGKTARKANEKTGMNLNILRVNRQIHKEALPLFYGKNTFYVSSIPDSPPSTTQISAPEKQLELGLLGTFDPPLPRSNWSLIRHLTINMLYLPETLVSEPSADGIGWKPIDPGATAYISLLVSLLQNCTSRLLSLTLVADVPTEFDAKKCLVSFFMCDANISFSSALANLGINEHGREGLLKKVFLAFEFPDCYLRMSVEPVVFMKKSILLLACQVMLCQSQVRVMRLLGEFDKGRVEEEVEVVSEERRTDLGPLVGSKWFGERGGGVGIL